MKKTVILVIASLLLAPTCFAQTAKGDDYRVAAGLFGVKADVAGRDEVKKYAAELAKDADFFNLTIVNVNRSDYGILFIYASKAPEIRDKVRAYINAFYDRFGGVDKARAVENWGVYDYKDASDPVVVSKKVSKPK